jgi:hypothetical protein
MNYYANSFSWKFSLLGLGTFGSRGTIKFPTEINPFSRMGAGFHIRSQLAMFSSKCTILELLCKTDYTPSST